MGMVRKINNREKDDAEINFWPLRWRAPFR